MDPTRTEPTVSGYRHSLLWNLAFSSYWFATSYKWFILLIVLIPGRVQELVYGGEASRTWGLIFGAGAIWAVFGPALFGTISDNLTSKYGRRKPFIALGSGLTLIALFLVFRAEVIWVLAVGYLLLQISDDVGTGPYSAMIPEVVPENRRGHASSILGMLQSLGQVSSAVVGLVLGNVALIFIGIGVVNVLCAWLTIYSLKGIKSEPAIVSTESILTRFIAQWKAPWVDADFRWVWFTRFINSLGFYLVSTYLLFYLTRGFDAYVLFGRDLQEPETAVQVLAVSISLFGAVGAIISARLSDSFGRKKLIYAAGVVLFCSLLPFAFYREFTATFILAIFFGTAYGIYVAADWALISDVLPNKETAGTEMGVWQSSISSVQIIAGGSGVAIAALNAWGLERGTQGIEGFMAAIVAAAFLFLISCFLVSRVRGSF